MASDTARRGLCFLASRETDTDAPPDYIELFVVSDKSTSQGWRHDQAPSRVSGFPFGIQHGNQAALKHAIDPAAQCGCVAGLPRISMYWDATV